ncbi:hypothetical protein C8J55DRAFT_519342 [Lentinula edodes]|uniref:RING-type domain-containing protein n=1 Tax=Lentinula lateritia TaxID=40482 RepID=A0A9W9A5L5_9AGAR|nr:hypothetical protein C8J55DRAFT_519342 [Lentinula edodes]
MASECCFCLSALKEPVCIPCGHIFCSPCISSRVAASCKRDTTPCPTCRAPFEIVTPELATVSKHVRRYINPGVRRVFLDSPDSETLRQRLSATEVQIKRLKRESDKLRASNESKKRRFDQVKNDWKEKNDQLLAKYTCKKRKLDDATSALQEMKERLDASHAANVQKTAALAQLAKIENVWQKQFLTLKAEVDEQSDRSTFEARRAEAREEAAASEYHSDLTLIKERERLAREDALRWKARYEALVAKWVYRLLHG